MPPVRNLAWEATRSPTVGPPTYGPVRGLRGAVVGLSATWLAYAGHATAGGVPPSGGALAGATLVAVTVAIGLSNRRWTMSSLLVVLLGAQVGFHLAFSGHSMTGTPAMAGMPSMGVTGHPGWVMVLSHLLAAVVTAVVLLRGEDWTWRVLELVSRPVRLPRPGLPALPTPSTPRTTPTSAVPPPRSRCLDDVQPRRGPPAADAC